MIGSNRCRYGRLTIHTTDRWETCPQAAANTKMHACGEMSVYYEQHGGKATHMGTSRTSYIVRRQVVYTMEIYDEALFGGWGLNYRSRVPSPCRATQRTAVPPTHA